MLSIQAVHTPLDRGLLLELLCEYESGLPEDLRHGAAPTISVANNLSEPPNAGLIAFDRGTAAGCVIVRHLDAETAIVARLYVRPRARGLGLGRTLVQAAIDCAEARPYRRLVLDTDKTQLGPAYELYLSFGFRPCAPFAPVAYENPTYLELPLH